MKTSNGCPVDMIISVPALVLFAAFCFGTMTGCSTYQKDVVSPAQEAQENARFGLDAYRVSTFESDGHVSAPELDIDFTAGEGKSLSRDVVIEKPVAPNSKFSCDENELGSGCKYGAVISTR